MGYAIFLNFKFFSENVFIFMQLPLSQSFYELFFCFLRFSVHVLPFYTDLLRLRLRFAPSLTFSYADSLRFYVYIISCGLAIQPEEYTPSYDTNCALAKCYFADS